MLSWAPVPATIWRQLWGMWYGELSVTRWKEWWGRLIWHWSTSAGGRSRVQPGTLVRKDLHTNPKGKPESGYWHSDGEGEVERNLRPTERWKSTSLEVKAADEKWLNMALRFEVWQNGDATVSKEESVGGDVAEGDTHTHSLSAVGLMGFHTIPSRHPK